MGHQQTFRGKLVRPAGTGTWTYVRIPFDVVQVFGAKGQFKVKAGINGVSLRGSLMPEGDGTHYLVIPKAVRDTAGVTAGDEVDVVIVPDSEIREVEIPEDLAAALAGNERAKAVYVGFAYSHQEAYAEWIESAKKPETRQRRIEKAMELLAEAKKLK